VEFWRLSATYSYVDLQLEIHGTDINRGAFLEGATPRHQFGLRSFLDLPLGFQFDVQYRFVDELRSLPDVVSGEGISQYSELDARLSWRNAEEFEVAIVGQNLLHDRHPEFGTPEARGEIQRAVYAKVTWGF
jgi:iron complex outermembrane receptor protein